MEKYYGMDGKAYLIGDRIAGGGEGTVYAVKNDNTIVAKIYRGDKQNKGREDKLCHMVRLQPSAEQLEEITWPLDVIYAHEGFVGYIMKKLQHTDSITRVYSSSGKTYSLEKRLLVAYNLCNAVKTVHDMGQVCGDLNPQNICVNLDETSPYKFHVTLVDTDSYHFTDPNGEIYRCEVGMADYIAPELSKKLTDGRTLRNITLPTYTRETDLFALAVHIFSLLMNGCHPFACAKKMKESWKDTMQQMSADFVQDSVVAPQPIENIKNGFFPFYHIREGIEHPLYAPAFSSLPERLQKLFIRTFVNGYQDPSQRVGAGEWMGALREKANDMEICPVKGETHIHFITAAPGCPFCDAEERMRVMLQKGGVVPDVPLKKNSEDSTSSSGGGGGSKEPPDDPRKSWSERWSDLLVDIARVILIAAIVVFIVLALIIMASGAYTDTDSSEVPETTSELIENATPSPREKYESCLNEVTAYIQEKKYDEAEKILTKAREYAEQGDFSSAEAETLKGQIDEAVAEQIRQQEKQEKQRKINQKRLKYGKRILKYIKKKKYNKAVNLIIDDKEYMSKKVYIQNGKLVNTIKKGKGFLYDSENYYAYIGYFKNGKVNGSGIEVGVSIGEYYTIKGKFKKGYPNGKCTVYYSQYLFDSDITFIGNYKRGWENGKFKMIDKALDGGHSDTYYFTSVMGTRKIIRMEGKKYVYATADSGWYYYEKHKSDLKGHSTPRYGKK